MVESPTKSPSCFISYCHDDADFDAIKFFENELRKCSNEPLEIFRDKDNIRPGDPILKHEQVIYSVDVVVILLTRKYHEKVTGRSGGVYREFSMIMNRLSELSAAQREYTDEFQVVPIVFSGTFEDVKLSDLAGLFCPDFSGFRPAPSRDGTTILPDQVQQNHAHLFRNIRDKIAATALMRTDQFRRRSEEMKQILFQQTRHEAVAQQFEKKSMAKVLDAIFVKTRSYLEISAQNSVILVGRKGSGKSTIADYVHRNSAVKYKPKIHVNVDDFNMNTVFSIIFPPKISSDIENIFGQARFFTIVWRFYVYVQAAKVLVHELERGKLNKEVKKHIQPVQKTIIQIFDIKRKKRLRMDRGWPEFVWIMNKLIGAIDEIIAKARNTSSEFYADVLLQADEEEILHQVFGSEFLDSLEECIQSCKRRFLFVLDGFDSSFEEFRIDTIRGHYPSVTTQFRNKLEVDWLKGLLHCILEVRSRDDYLQDKMDFCVTIPHDRFFEVRATERDDYRYRGIYGEIKWTGVELSMLLRKRLEAISDGRTRKIPPLDRLDSILRTEFNSIPTQISFDYGGNSLTIGLFSYLLRHTFWRPREMLFLMAKILTSSELQKKRDKKLSAEAIRSTVASSTYSLVRSEFFREFQSVCTNIEEVVKRFERSKNILSFDEIEERIGACEFKYATPPYSGGGQDPLSKIGFLYEIGFIGFDAPEDLLHAGHEVQPEIFYFSHGAEIYEAMSMEQRKALRYVVHPVFKEYLRLIVDQKRLVNFYRTEFLEANDALNTSG